MNNYKERTAYVDVNILKFNPNCPLELGALFENAKIPATIDWRKNQFFDLDKALNIYIKYYKYKNNNETKFIISNTIERFNKSMFLSRLDTEYKTDNYFVVSLNSNLYSKKSPSENKFLAYNIEHFKLNCSKMSEAVKTLQNNKAFTISKGNTFSGLSTKISYSVLDDVFFKDNKISLEDRLYVWFAFMSNHENAHTIFGKLLNKNEFAGRVTIKKNSKKEILIDRESQSNLDTINRLIKKQVGKDLFNIFQYSRNFRIGEDGLENGGRFYSKFIGIPSYFKKIFYESFNLYEKDSTGQQIRTALTTLGMINFTEEFDPYMFIVNKTFTKNVTPLHRTLSKLVGTRYFSLNGNKEAITHSVLNQLAEDGIIYSNEAKLKKSSLISQLRFDGVEFPYKESSFQFLAKELCISRKTAFKSSTLKNKEFATKVSQRKITKFIYDLVDVYSDLFSHISREVFHTAERIESNAMQECILQSLRKGHFAIMCHDSLISSDKNDFDIFYSLSLNESLRSKNNSKNNSKNLSRNYKNFVNKFYSKKIKNNTPTHANHLFLYIIGIVKDKKSVLRLVT